MNKIKYSLIILAGMTSINSFAATKMFSLVPLTPDAPISEIDVWSEFKDTTQKVKYTVNGEGLVFLKGSDKSILQLPIGGEDYIESVSVQETKSELIIAFKASDTNVAFSQICSFNKKSYKKNWCQKLDQSLTINNKLITIDLKTDTQNIKK